jgi:hypothetical protein
MIHFLFIKITIFFSEFWLCFKPYYHIKNESKHAIRQSFFASSSNLPDPSQIKSNTHLYRIRLCPYSNTVWILPIWCTNTLSTSPWIVFKTTPWGSRMVNISHSHTSEVYRAAVWAYYWQPLIIAHKI